MTHPDSSGVGTGGARPPGPGWAPPPGPPPNWTPPRIPEPGWAPPNGSRPAPMASPQPQWGPPPKPSPLPVEPKEYPQFWRAPGIRWWKPVLAVVLGVLGFLFFGFVIVLIGLFVEAAVNGRSFLEVAQELGENTITPITFLANSVSLGLLVPLTFVLSRLVGQKGGWMSSVVGGVRWRWLAKCFGVSLVAVTILVGVDIYLGGWANQELALRPGWWWLLIGIIVVTPFQAAGEEYLIRGLLNRAVASFVPARLAGAVLGAVLSSLVFMLIHAADDPWLNVTYFSMGMLFSYLAWRTGGLEAAVAMHAANNLVSMLFLPFQDISEVFDRAEGTGDPTVLIQVGLLGVAALVIVRMARRSSIDRVGPPRVVIAGR